MLERLSCMQIEEQNMKVLLASCSYYLSSLIIVIIHWWCLLIENFVQYSS